ncbi:MAG: T9SS type A sorting domain-containing protein [Bacteroidales bacterium]|nr:T9SS type A sorting domain-containing protein [Bacteroidales bacterium]
MKKLTLLALTLGMTFGVFAQKFVSGQPTMPFNGNIENLMSAKSVAVKSPAANVHLTVSDFTGDDAKLAWHLDGDTAGCGMLIALFTVENELDGEDLQTVYTVLNQLLQGGQIYHPFNMNATYISEIFSDSQTGEKTYLEDGKIYSFWLAFMNAAAVEGADGAEYSYAYCNFTGNGVLSEGAHNFNDLVGLDMASVVITNVYPNPASDVVTITAASKINSLEVVNTLGQVVYTMDVNNQTATLNTASFEKGTYVVRLSTELGKAASKLYVR